MSRRLRCAIYTRKSTEEGLEQNFNSLHAQREACEAYVLSQAGEGWSAIRTLYDDGGFSGGSIERPALKALMEDIRKGHVDIVVVYKVDRLTRSLADFAKIVELFDARGVSFVSVTQAFNTTTSMGRLTLNVLLSFAQFEREVTGERIRDKVAASKAKGLRMGGSPPLGYDIKDGRLAVNEAEAPVVRHIFSRYLELGSTLALVEALKQEGVTAKRWTTKAGRVAGGGVMGRGPLYYLLSNPAYVGVTRHKDKRYPRTHPAIVDQAVWDEVQVKLKATNARRPSTPKRGEGALLKGLLFDQNGEPMVPTHAVKGPRRYRYYVSRSAIEGRTTNKERIRRISAGVIEQAVVELLQPHLASGWMSDADPALRVRDALVRLAIHDGLLVATLRPEAAASASEVRLPYHLRRRGGAQVAAAGRSSPVRLDRTLVRAVVRAREWMRRLEAGEVPSVKALAEQEGLCLRYTTRLLPLAYLAPDLTAAILEGRHSRVLTVSTLTAKPPPLEWEQQRQWVRSLA